VKEDEMGNIHGASRMARRGLTVIEVAVIAVLLVVLGAMIVVVNIAIVDVPRASKSKLDATALTDYYKFLSLNMQDGGAAKIERSPMPHARGSHLLQWLVQQDIVKIDHARKLAGASGVEASEADWKSQVQIDTQIACIFTCPSVPSEFVARATAKDSRSGIFMCYNQHYAFKYVDDGMVVLMAGRQRAELKKYVDIADEVDGPERPMVTPKVGDLSFYGKFPFEGIARE